MEVLLENYASIFHYSFIISLLYHAGCSVLGTQINLAFMHDYYLAHDYCLQIVCKNHKEKQSRLNRAIGQVGLVLYSCVKSRKWLISMRIHLCRVALVSQSALFANKKPRCGEVFSTKSVFADRGDPLFERVRTDLISPNASAFDFTRGRCPKISPRRKPRFHF